MRSRSWTERNWTEDEVRAMKLTHSQIHKLEPDQVWDYLRPFSYRPGRYLQTGVYDISNLKYITLFELSGEDDLEQAREELFFQLNHPHAVVAITWGRCGPLLLLEKKPPVCCPQKSGKNVITVP
jgi:hypothetical protein